MSETKTRARHSGRFAAVALGLLVLAGCVAPIDPPPVAQPTLEVVAESTGWVQVRADAAGVAAAYIVWDEPSTETTVVSPTAELYEHFYSQVGPHTIRLLADGAEVARQTVDVAVVDCHAVLVRVDGRTVTCRAYARFGVDYSLVWGDGFAEGITAAVSATLVSHTYEEAGTYAVRMGETWAPARPMFIVTVE